MGEPLRVGVVGLGKISEQYFTTLLATPSVTVVAVADIDQERALECAKRLGVPAMPVDSLVSSPDVDTVLNLTIPAAHADVSRKAVRAGKSVFVEKPLALDTLEGKALLQEAEAAGVRIGCAPDTLLGTGIQTAVDSVKRGQIGEVVAASAVWSAPGHETWHPSPHFYYQPGAGPLLDMGPYFISALVSILGPVAQVAGHTARSRRERTVSTGDLAGTEIPVEVDTHVNALLVHESGASSTVTMSFEVWGSRMTGIEVYGTSGTLSLPDPFRFTGDVEILRAGDDGWTALEPSAGYRDGGRGIGLLDMATAIETGQPHHASGELALHVLETMNGVLAASRNGRTVDIASTVELALPLRVGNAANGPEVYAR